MKQRLQTVWANSNNLDGLLQALEEWCHAAEASGIGALQEFSNRLKRYEAAPA
jgi:stearoyl-CoA desaturase (delta-9 desaturase)